MYEVNSEGQIKEVKININKPSLSLHQSLPQLRGYTDSIIVHTQEKLSPYSVLQIISDFYQTIQSLLSISDIYIWWFTSRTKRPLPTKHLFTLYISNSYFGNTFNEDIKFL